MRVLKLFVNKDSIKRYCVYGVPETTPSLSSYLIQGITLAHYFSPTISKKISNVISYLESEEQNTENLFNNNYNSFSPFTSFTKEYRYSFSKFPGDLEKILDTLLDLAQEQKKIITYDTPKDIQLALIHRLAFENITDNLFK